MLALRFGSRIAAIVVLATANLARRAGLFPRWFTVASDLVAALFLTSEMLAEPTAAAAGERARRRTPDAPIRRPGRAVLVATQWIEAAACRWHAQVFATEAPAGRPPIVLVHGLGIASRSLLPTARALAPQVPTYVPDLPGFGRSSRPRHILDVPQLARALGAWLDAVGLTCPVLLGHSLGCQTVVALAVQQPARLGAVVLVGPTGEPRVGRGRWAGRLLRDLPRDPLTAVPLVAHDNLRAGPRRVWRTARAMVDDPFVARLPSVQRPVLVVRGARDPIAPAVWAAQVAQTLAAGQLATVADAAHLVPYSQPEALAALVAAFLVEQDLTSGA